MGGGGETARGVGDGLCLGIGKNFGDDGIGGRQGEDGDGDRVEKVHGDFSVAGGLGDLDGLLLRWKGVAAVRRRMLLNMPVSKSC